MLILFCNVRACVRACVCLCLSFVTLVALSMAILLLTQSSRRFLIFFVHLKESCSRGIIEKFLAQDSASDSEYAY